MFKAYDLLSLANLRLAKAYLARKTNDDIQKAGELIDTMVDDWPMRIVVYLQRMDWLEASGKGAGEYAKGGGVPISSESCLN